MEKQIKQAVKKEENCENNQVVSQQVNKQDQSIKQHQRCYIIDIDGTLIISHKQIPGSSEALNYLSAKNVPYLLLTNNIAQSQQKMAQYCNQHLKLTTPIKKQQVILSYTPLRNIIDYKNKVVLMIGREVRFKEVLPFDHIPYYVTIQEYCSIFPEIVPLARRKKDERAEGIKREVEKRLGIQNITLENLKFGLILIINCPVNWEQSLQVVMDLLNSQDGGFPTQKPNYKYCPNHIPIFSTINDMLYMIQKCNLPRILIRPFNNLIKSTFKQIYNHELNLQIFGKPQPLVYDFTQKYSQEVFGKIKKFVMIGDNPQVDVMGAFMHGWDSILFKSGVATEDSKQAIINCQNLLEGIQRYQRAMQRAKKSIEI